MTVNATDAIWRRVWVWDQLDRSSFSLSIWAGSDLLFQATCPLFRWQAWVIWVWLYVAKYVPGAHIITRRQLAWGLGVSYPAR